MDVERRDDWKKGVDENLAMLNSARRTTDTKLDEIEERYEALDDILRGDPTEDTDGLIARQHAIENMHNELRTQLHVIRQALYGDHAGGDGFSQRLDRLDGKRDRADKREGYFWHFLTAVAVQVLILAGVLLLNWDRVEDFIRSRFHFKPDKVEQLINDAKKPRHRRRKPKPIVLPEAQSDEPDAQEVP